ncbi:hypothetical protein LguiA_019775 [Lonicera macranthoides]
MDDSFRVRVEKTFGSLAAAASSSSSSSSSSDTHQAPSSLWTLTDEEIEKREWNRDKDIPDDDLDSKPYPSNLDGFFANQGQVPKPMDPDLLELDGNGEHDDDDGDEEEEEEEEENDKQRRRGQLTRQLVKPEDHNDEEWDIRSSIGLDSTLDNEEEEDAYDKVAIGVDRNDDCLHLGGVSDYKIEMNSCNELPNTFGDVDRDSRANHMAAKARLKEDAEAAGNFNSLRVSYDTTGPQNSTPADGVNPKSILKKRGNQVVLKTEKRVRFDPACKDDCKEVDYEGTENLAMGSAVSIFPQDSAVLPDFVRNPSKYTHYTFDSSSDLDEESNRKAYMDFLNLLKGPSAMDPEDDIRKNPPKTVTFTPKKRAGDDSMKNKLKEMEEDFPKKSFPVCIAESEICAMEEDEPGTLTNNSSSLRKKGRRYRTKASSDLDDLVA